VLITAEGETTMPKFALIRLEDIGPGGQYDSLEQLGKLRAVIDYMQGAGIPVHLAVIPRWINVDATGNKYDRSLDDPNDPLCTAFTHVLREAVERGASVGMHGYTHQVGDVKRKDGFQESAIGNEFNVDGLPETDSAAFADSRVREGLRIMRSAGLPPRFWEAPHYHTTAAQDAVFRRYFGLLYQADNVLDRNASEAQYRNERIDGAGLGNVNVPTPFSYIPYNRDETIILDKLGRSKNIVSFFYHPFLEFQHLTPVLDSNGMAVLRDGIPEYRYPTRERDKTMLQKLALKLKERGYVFYSIHDYVPFTPGTTMTLGAAGTELTQLGDVDGDGAADLVRWQSDDTVSVTAAPFRSGRGEPRPEAKKWTSIPFSKGSVVALCDTNGDRKSDLWIVRGSKSGTLERYDSSGSGFTLAKSWSVFGAFGKGVRELFVLPLPSGDAVVAGLTPDELTLQGVYVHGNKATAMRPYKFKTNNEKHFTVSRDAAGLARPEAPALVLARRDEATLVALIPDVSALEWKVHKADLDIPDERGDMTLGDFNGDGREDIVRYDAESLKYSVYLQQEDGTHKLLSTFGPWGSVGGKLVASDLDGNGECDLALFERAAPYVDAALSFETRRSPVLEAE
jgi:hypothetical protein